MFCQCLSSIIPIVFWKDWPIRIHRLRIYFVVLVGPRKKGFCPTHKRSYCISIKMAAVLFKRKFSRIQHVIFRKQTNLFETWNGKNKFQGVDKSLNSRNSRRLRYSYREENLHAIANRSQMITGTQRNLPKMLERLLGIHLPHVVNFY